MIRSVSAVVIGAIVALTAVTPDATQPAASRPPVPAYQHGPASEMTVFLDFGGRLAGGGSGITDADVYTIFAGVAAYLNPPLGVTVTTVQPAARPGEYVTVRFLSSGVVSWRTSVVGSTPVKMIKNTSRYVPNVCYVCKMPPEQAAAVAAHEAAHCLQSDGESHEDTPVGDSPNLMGPAAPVGGKFSPRMTAAIKKTIVDLRAGRRLGAFLTPSGTWTFDWFKLSP